MSLLPHYHRKTRSYYSKKIKSAPTETKGASTVFQRCALISRGASEVPLHEQELGKTAPLATGLEAELDVVVLPVEIRDVGERDIVREQLFCRERSIARSFHQSNPFLGAYWLRKAHEAPPMPQVHHGRMSRGDRTSRRPLPPETRITLLGFVHGFSPCSRGHQNGSMNMIEYHKKRILSTKPIGKRPE